MKSYKHYKTCYTTIEPNTRIQLEELTDEHLETIIRIFRDVGLKWDQKIPSAREVVRGLEAQSEYELRPTMADISKMFITQRPYESSDYIHVYITYNSRARAPDGAREHFDQRMRRDFIS